MHITLIPDSVTTSPDLLAAALEHIRPAVGPLRFRSGEPGSASGTQPFRRRRDGQPLKGELVLEVGAPGADWSAWQTTALPGEPNRARLAVRTGPDWYETRPDWLLAFTALRASLQLLLGPEQIPHPLPKTCLHHADPADRVAAHTLIRGAYICKGCCDALLSRGLDHFALDQLQEAVQLVRAGLVRPQHYRPRPGRLRLTETSGRLTAWLPDYGPEQLGLEPLQLALYVLLLRHPTGLPATLSQSRAEALTQELAALYQRTNLSATAAQAREKARAALNGARLRELCSFINAELETRTPAAVTAEYRVQRGSAGPGRRVLLARTMVEDRAGALAGSEAALAAEAAAHAAAN
jgi:hypothetical protein